MGHGHHQRLVAVLKFVDPTSVIRKHQNWIDSNTETTDVLLSIRNWRPFSSILVTSLTYNEPSQSSPNLMDADLITCMISNYP